MNWQPLAGIAMATLVGGCALAGSPAPATYDIDAPREIASSRSSSAQLAILEPSVVGALDSQQIVVRPAPTQVTYLAKSQWSDRAPRLVQARLIDAFQNSGRVRSVGLPGGAVVSDVGLVSDLHAFQIDAARNVAVIEMTVRLVREADGRVAASQRFTATAPVAGEGAQGMIDAMNVAFDQIAGEIVVWTLARI